MDALKESSRSCRATFAMFAVTVSIVAAGWLAAGTSKAASPEKASVAKTELVRSFSLKEWLLFAK